LEGSFIGQLGKLVEPVFIPLGFDWKVSVALLAGIAAKEVVVSTLGVLNLAESAEGEVLNSLGQKLKDAKHSYPGMEGKPVFNTATAFGLLIFILIYFPCIAVIAATKRESGGWKWALFMAAYTSGLAWFLSWMVQLFSRLL